MIVTKKTPTLDLHGEIVSMVEVLVNEFIKDNLKLKRNPIVIVHGKSTNIITKEVHNVLKNNKNNKNIKHFYLDNWNLGRTIIELNV